MLGDEDLRARSRIRFSLSGWPASGALRRGWPSSRGHRCGPSGAPQEVPSAKRSFPSFRHGDFKGKASALPPGWHYTILRGNAVIWSYRPGQLESCWPKSCSAQSNQWRERRSSAQARNRQSSGRHSAVGQKQRQKHPRKRAFCLLSIELPREHPAPLAAQEARVGIATA